MVYGLRATLVSTFAAALIMPAVASSQPLALAPSPLVWQAPDRVTEPVSTTDDRAHGPLTATRTAGLQRYRAADSTLAPERMQQRRAQNGNITLMVVGLATLLVGTVVDDDAGTVLVLTGAGVGLVGLYRYLNQ